MKKLIGIIVLIIIVIVIVVTSGSSKRAPNLSEPIKIGAVLSLTGDAAPWGESAKNGIDLAVKTINASGGVDGRPVEVIIEDDHTDSKNAVSAYNKLVNVDHVSGVIGSVFDFNTQPLLPLAEQNKITLITPPNFQIKGSFELGSQSFTMLVNFDDMVRKYKEYLAQDKIKKVAVVHFTSTWGVEISKVIGEIMTSYGKQKPIEETYMKIGGNDYRTTVLKLKNAGVDTVFLDMLGDDTLNFLKRSKELGFAPTFLTYTGALEIFNNEKDKSLIENIALVNWEITSPKFDEMYEKEYGTKPGKSADKSFDALYVLATAIAKTSKPSEVAAYISANTFKTPNAEINFMPDHTVKSVPIVIQTIKEGKLVEYK